MLTTVQAAGKLGISQRRVIALITSGRLPAKKFASVWMIDQKALAAVRVRKPGRPRKK